MVDGADAAVGDGLCGLLAAAMAHGCPQVRLAACEAVTAAWGGEEGSALPGHRHFRCPTAGAAAALPAAPAQSAAVGAAQSRTPLAGCAAAHRSGRSSGGLSAIGLTRSCWPPCPSPSSSSASASPSLPHLLRGRLCVAVIGREAPGPLCSQRLHRTGAGALPQLRAQAQSGRREVDGGGADAAADSAADTGGQWGGGGRQSAAMRRVRARVAERVSAPRPPPPLPLCRPHRLDCGRPPPLCARPPRLPAGAGGQRPQLLPALHSAAAAS